MVQGGCHKGQGSSSVTMLQQHPARDLSGQRLRTAQLLLLSPAARAVQQFEEHETTKEIRELISSRGFECSELARHGLGLGQWTSSQELLPSSKEDAADAMQTLLNLAIKLDGVRRPSREDVDEILRTMGRRKGRRPGLVLETFRLASELAEQAVGALQATAEEDQRFLMEAQDSQTKEFPVFKAGNKLFFRHLTPDTESCAAAIEALFACGAAEAAEDMLHRCNAVLPPNPALYSAVIFGRLYSGDGPGAIDAIFDMDKAGFTPHQRFILRCLRFMGPFHKEGLLLVDRLAFPIMQQRMLHVLMETCITSPDPAACAMDVYQSLLEKGYPVTPETHFALLKALCGMNHPQAAIEELHKLQAKHVLPEHIGFEILLCDCFGLAASPRRASQVIEARRHWVLEVCAALLSEPSHHLPLICQEMRRRYEAAGEASFEDKFQGAKPEQNAAGYVAASNVFDRAPHAALPDDFEEDEGNEGAHRQRLGFITELFSATTGNQQRAVQYLALASSNRGLQRMLQTKIKRPSAGSALALSTRGC